MNSTELSSPTLANHGSGLSYDTIANITIGVVNITMAAAQLVLGYLTYRTSRRRTFHYTTTRRTFY